jgi:RHS repeat-associated protein
MAASRYLVVFSVWLALGFLLSASVLSDQSSDDVNVTSRTEIGTGNPGPIALPPLPNFPSGSIVPSEAVGYLPGNGSVSSAGSAHYTIPLEVPPGRMGVQPQLSLEYSSSSGNGIAGVGWSLPGAISEIRRCAKNIASDGRTDGIAFQISDSFCLDGQKLTRVATIPRSDTPGDFDIEYRTQQDTFVKVITVGRDLANLATDPKAFRVYTRDGRIREYKPVPAIQAIGGTEKGLSGESFVMYRWLLMQESDRSGNNMTFEYALAPGEARLETISYTGNSVTGAKPLRKVAFKYKARPDPISGFEFGAVTKETARLTAIEMWAYDPITAQPSIAWSYNLDYTAQPSAITKRSLLERVRKCDGGSPPVCQWGKTFSWTKSISNQIVKAEWTADPEFVNSPGMTDYNRGWPDTGFIVFDADGDGKDDILYETDGQIFLRYEGLNKKAKVTSDLAFKSVGDPWNFVLGLSRAVDVDGDGVVELYAAQKRGLGGSNPGLWFGYQLYRFNKTANPPAMEAVGPFHALFKSSICDCGFSEAQVFPESHFIDMDGDGLPELLDVGANSDTDFGTWQFHMNTGGSFGPAIDTKVAAIGALSGKMRVSVMEEIDGNGRGDALLEDFNAVSLSSIGVLSVRPSGVHLGSAPDSTLKGRPIALFADLNGDGLRDMLTFHTNPAMVRWNMGNGFSPESSTQILIDDKGLGYVRAADVNGDGKDDLIDLNGIISVRFSIGDGTFTSPISLGEDAGRQTGLTGPPEDRAMGTTQLGDFDGDGETDIVQIHGDHLRLLGFPWRMNHDLLESVKDESASYPRESFEYSRDWWHYHTPSFPSCKFPTRCIRTGVPVVIVHATTLGEDSTGNPRYAQTDYSYDGPRADLQGRGFLGFSTVWAFERELNAETITSYDNETRNKCVDGSGVTVWFYPGAFAPSSEVRLAPIYDTPNTELFSGSTQNFTSLARVTKTNRATQTKCLKSSYFVKSQTWTMDESEQQAEVRWTSVRLLTDPNASKLRSRSGQSDYDDYGNLVFSKVATLNGVTRTVTNHYDIRDPLWLVNLLDNAKEAAYTGVAASLPPREMSYKYDPVGRLYQVDATDRTVRSTTVLARNDQRGLVTDITISAPDVPARTGKVIYDPEGVFVVQRINPLGHVTAELRHPALSVPVLVQDENGVQATAQLDGFGRLRSVVSPDGNNASLSYQAYVPASGHVAGVTAVTTRATGAISKVSTNEIGRTVLEVKRAFNPAQWIITGATSDGAGRPLRNYRPTIGQLGDAYSEQHWDSLGRPTKKRAPDGTFTTITHSMFKSESLDAAGHKSWVTRDLDNRPLYSVDVVKGPNGQPRNVVTSYTYQDFDELKSMVDADDYQVNSHPSTVSFDAVARQRIVTTPESGSRIYFYDGLGRLIKVQDAVGQTINDYDAIGRLYHTTYTAPGVTDVTTYTWDTGQLGPVANKKKALGQLGATLSPDGVTTTYGYDSLGRVNEQTWLIDQESFTIKLDYDPQGRAGRMTYPAPGFGNWPLSTKQTFNASGYLDGVVDITNPFAHKPLWSVLARNADGAVTHSQLGNNVQTDRVFNAVTGRLDTVHVWSGSDFHLDYDYDAVGNVQWRKVFGATGRFEKFDHDELDRLTDWTLSGVKRGPDGSWITQSSTHTVYGYDDIGNITSVTVDNKPQLNETATYKGPRPHALDFHSVLGKMDYDGLGRQTSGSGRTMTYTGFDLPRTIVSGGQTTSFAYDATGARVRKSTPGLTTVTLGGMYERRKKGPTNIDHLYYVLGEGRPVVQVTQHEGSASTNLYLENDGLGSVQIVMDAAGAETERRYFDPWGRRITSDGSVVTPAADAVAFGFTGQREDRELGLIDMKSRIYDPAQRRSLTPDTILPDPLYGQSFNRFAYVFNNPGRFIDPTGHTAIPGPGTEPPESRPSCWQDERCWADFGDARSKPQRRRTAPGNAQQPVKSEPGGGNDPRTARDWQQGQPEGTNGEYSSLDAFHNDMGRSAKPGGGMRECSGAGDSGCYSSGGFEGWFMRNARDLEQGLLGASALALGTAVGLTVFPAATGLSVLPGTGLSQVGGIGLGARAAAWFGLRVAPAAGAAGAAVTRNRHLLLGIRRFGLDSLAEELEAVTISAENPAWKQSFEKWIKDPNARITVSVGGFPGQNLYWKVINAASQAIRNPNIGGTRWEMMRLQEEGMLGKVWWVTSKGVVVGTPENNPFMNGQ